MVFLHELLSEEGFEYQKSLKTQKWLKFRDRRIQDELITLPIYICMTKEAMMLYLNGGVKMPSFNGSLVFSSRRRGRSLRDRI